MSFFDEYKETNFLDSFNLNDPIKIKLIPRNQIYFDDFKGFGIYLGEYEDESTGIIKGNFVNGLILGQTYEFHGTVQVYNGEKQINVKNYFNVQPVNKKGIIAYLMTLHGLKNKAYDIFEVFGFDSIKVLTENPNEVVKRIRGIGKKSVEKWKAELEQMEESHYVLATLYGYGISVKDTKKLLKAYGVQIIDKIAENPYFLSREVSGYGFLKCDKIAREINFDMRSMFRIEEGILHAMEKIMSAGHVYANMKELVGMSKSILDIYMPELDKKRILSGSNRSDSLLYYLDSLKFDLNYYDILNHSENKFPLITFETSLIETAISSLIKKSAIILEDEDKVYFSKYYFAEFTIARKIEELSIEKNFNNGFDIYQELGDYLIENKINLAQKQYEAVVEIASKRGGIYVLTGNAGSGKTFVLKIILEMLKRQFKASGGAMELGLYAPTGKASKVASEATGIECKTIHRGLEFIPNQGFAFNEEFQLPKNVVAVDETSMLDTLLAESLLKAIQIGTKVIFMGDIKQLAPVGSGDVLRDIMKSGFVKVIELDVPQRQKDDSGIILNADRVINHQEMASSEATKDFYVMYKNSEEEALNMIHKSVLNLMDNRNFTFNEIQILVPQKMGITGINYLNYFFQSKFNPVLESDAKVLNKKISIKNPITKSNEECNLYFKKGDKVINIKNDYSMNWYQKDIFGRYEMIQDIIGITNGETGTIEDILEVKEDGVKYFKIIVNIDGKYVIYEQKFDALEHAYALTVHKSQGSQWEAVIFVLSLSVNQLMLVNSIVYTAITRAKSLCAVIGYRRSLLIAIKNEKFVQRNTMLSERIKSMFLDK